jgi:hypothetical protein
MSSSNVNGSVQRKSLSGQIDRLDLILDGLADGLNTAVATVVTEAVTKAVEAAVQEVLTSAELQKRLNPPPKSSSKLKSVCGWLSNAAKAAGSWLTKMAFCGREKAAEAFEVINGVRTAIVSRVRRGMSNLGRRVWLGTLMAWSLARHYRKPLLVALASGTLLGVACYCAGPTVASLVSGFAGFVGSLVASSLKRLRRVMAGQEVEDWCYGRVR